MVRVDAREPRLALREELRVARDLVPEAKRVRSHLGELDLDREHVLELRRGAIAKVRLDDGQVPAAIGPRLVRDTAAP